jgi:RNA polymerase sigma-70 factor (ECF subfamily)
MSDLAQHDSVNTTDEQLVLAVGRGDCDALRRLVYRHQDRLQRFAWHVLHDRAAAEDAVQDAFLRVFQSADRFDPTGNAANWLYRITLNLCRDRLRKQKRGIVSLDQMASPPAAQAEPDPMETQERRRQIHQAVAELPRRQHTAVILHRYENLTHRQIAEITGWSTSAVESLLVRAYAQLRGELAHLVCPAE